MQFSKTICLGENIQLYMNISYAEGSMLHFLLVLDSLVFKASRNNVFVQLVHNHYKANNAYNNNKNINHIWTKYFTDELA